MFCELLSRQPRGPGGAWGHPQTCSGCSGPEPARIWQVEEWYSWIEVVVGQMCWEMRRRCAYLGVGRSGQSYMHTGGRCAGPRIDESEHGIE